MNDLMKKLRGTLVVTFLGVATLVGGSGCNASFAPGGDSCQFIADEHGSVTGSETSCEGDVVVTQRTRCDNAVNHFVADGPPSRQTCPTGRTCIASTSPGQTTAECGQACFVNEECSPDQYCVAQAEVRVGTGVCKPRLTAGAACTALDSCVPGRACLPTAMNVDADAALPDASIPDADASTVTPLPFFTCQ